MRKWTSSKIDFSNVRLKKKYTHSLEKGVWYNFVYGSFTYSKNLIQLYADGLGIMVNENRYRPSNVVKQALHHEVLHGVINSITEYDKITPNGDMKVHCPFHHGLDSFYEKDAKKYFKK